MYGGSSDTFKARTYCPCTQWGCAKTLPPTVKLSRDEMKVAELRWKSAHPASTQFQKDLLRQVSSSNPYRYRSPFGHVKYFYGRWRDVSKQILNYPMQHCAINIINRAQRQLELRGHQIILQWHDSLTTQTPQRFADECATEMKLVMEQPVPELGGVVFPVDIKIGPNLGNQTKWLASR
ncbi:hypothetical protein LCGC14_2100470 [marine sediment metagenome]|uniref:DNA-directed DNA polymerase family A palm domain-containing protein n=1 Tax=marine sediment metagenome TaxID=412755 RepID=A0A0F9EA91_9ZZZZ